MMYRLKTNINHVDFLKEIKKCDGDVYFVTSEGDSLNLKSCLSQFMFAASLLTLEISESSWIQCKVETDYAILKEFIENVEV